MAMHPEKSTGDKANRRERGSRFLRNANVIGAVALFGLAAIAPPLAAGGLNTLAALDVVQAGGFEAARRHYAKNRRKKHN